MPQLRRILRQGVSLEWTMTWHHSFVKDFNADHFTWDKWRTITLTTTTLTSKDGQAELEKWSKELQHSKLDFFLPQDRHTLQHLSRPHTVTSMNRGFQSGTLAQLSRCSMLSNRMSKLNRYQTLIAFPIHKTDIWFFFKLKLLDCNFRDHCNFHPDIPNHSMVSSNAWLPSNAKRRMVGGSDAISRSHVWIQNGPFLRSKHSVCSNPEIFLHFVRSILLLGLQQQHQGKSSCKDHSKTSWHMAGMDLIRALILFKNHI